ncbi:MAG TPA: YciI family protein [Longimicrobium sp.]|nr:YciI family protein [Longimicrobium sp.]
MKYLCLIYDDENIWATMPKDECDAMLAEYFTFTDEIEKSGQHLAGEALQPVATATTVRVRNGKLSTTDGPFAETKEQLGGFYLVEARDLNEAIQVAARIPSARLGSIEVRPVVDFEQMDASESNAELEAAPAA